MTVFQERIALRISILQNKVLDPLLSFPRMSKLVTQLTKQEVRILKVQGADGFEMNALKFSEKTRMLIIQRPFNQGITWRNGGSTEHKKHRAINSSSLENEADVINLQ